MELFDHLWLGFSTAALPVNLLFCFIGVFLGTAVGVLPGVGSLATIAMLLPITYKVAPEASLIMLAGIYYGAQYGGSTTAILINLPGEAGAIVTAIDGHQMARNGRAGAALAAAAIGSFFAGTVATVIVALLAIPMTRFALLFGPVEYFALMTLGLIASITLASGSVVKALAMIMLGILLGSVGTDLYSGRARFTFGFESLVDGITIVAFGTGIYGISEILKGLESDRVRTLVVQKVTSLMPTREEIRRSIAPILRGTGIGSVLGVLPGGGALLSSFAAYSLEKRFAKESTRFGKGAIEGVAGPESANNAGAQTSFIPMLTLGIPSNAVMALMISAMVIHGIQPGPEFISRQPALFWGVVASMWIGNLMLVILNLPLIGLWVRLLTVPAPVLYPAIITFASVGVYSVSLSSFEVYLMVLFGFLGYVLVKLSFEPAPLVLGFVLGPMIEEYFRRAMIISRGDPMVFLQHPISAAMLALAAVILMVTLFPKVARKREEVFAEEEK